MWTTFIALATSAFGTPYGVFRPRGSFSSTVEEIAAAIAGWPVGRSCAVQERFAAVAAAIGTP